MGELLESGRGSYTRFRPGQPLGAAGNEFVTSVVKPAVKGYVSRLQAWLIVFWDYFNTIVLITGVQFFLWIGIANLFIYYIWPYPYEEEYEDLSNFTEGTNETLKRYFLQGEQLLPNLSDIVNSTEEATEFALSQITTNDLVYICIGYFLYFLSIKFFSMNESYTEMSDAWKKGLPESFGFRRKTLAYGRTFLNFFGIFVCHYWGLGYI
jgi:hypothetical protein